MLLVWCAATSKETDIKIPAFLDLPTVYYSGTQCFGNWTCFRPPARRLKGPTQA